MSGDCQHGDNPLHTYSPLHLTTLSPTFHHRYGYVDSVVTTFFPLTLSGEGFFYYMYFPAKKGRLSSGRGETNVVSVLTPFNEESVGYLDPNEVDIIRPFIERQGEV